MYDVIVIGAGPDASSITVWGESSLPKRVLSAYEDSTRPLREYMKRQWHLTSGMSEAFREMKL